MIKSYDLYPQTIYKTKYPFSLDNLVNEISFLKKSNNVRDNIKTDSFKNLVYTEKNILTNYPVFSQFNSFLSFFLLKNFKNKFNLIDSWVSIYKKYGYVDFHNHYPADLSGVFYLQLPPLDNRIHIHNSYDPSEFNRFKIEEGDIILFKGNQYHSTPPNFSKIKKIVIAFNLKEID